jgi:putative membrane protein
LQQAQGAQFDQAYIQQQVQAHQTAVDMFRNYAQSGDDAKLKQFASQTLPALQQHLQMAQELQRTVHG